MSGVAKNGLALLARFPIPLLVHQGPSRSDRRDRQNSESTAGVWPAFKSSASNLGSGIDSLTISVPGDRGYELVVVVHNWTEVAKID